MDLRKPGTPIRRSASRQDSKGSRQEIPQHASLQILRPEHSSGPSQQGAERQGVSSSPGSRCRTPAGSMPPCPRRIEQSPLDAQNSFPGLPQQEDSMASCTSVEGRMSVASGRLENAGTFFTGLRRDYVQQQESFLGEDEGGSLICDHSSRNPMQSPSTSQYFSAADDQDDYISASGLQEEYSRAASLLCSEYTNPMLTPEGSQLVTPSANEDDTLLFLMRSIYGSDRLPLDASTSNMPSQAPVIPNPVSSCSGPIAASRQGKQDASECSSRSSSDKSSSMQLEAPEASASSPNPPMSGVLADLLEMAGQEIDNNYIDSHGSINDRQEQLHRGGNADTSESSNQDGETTAAPLSAAGHGLAANLEAHALPSLGPVAPDAEGNTPGASEMAQMTQELIVQEQQEQDAQADLRTEQQQSMSKLQQLEERLVERSQLQQELGQYVQEVKEGVDEAGDKLVELPPGYMFMVEQMLQEARAQSEALFGWDGPRRYQDLPIRHLPKDYEDPKIEEGIQCIRELDDKLKEVALKALITAREADPSKWAEAERIRMEKRAAQLDMTLAAARKKHQHAARLSRALMQLGLQDGQEQQVQELRTSIASVASTMQSIYRYYMLTPAEEELVKAVMERDDAILEYTNPFDISNAFIELEVTEEDPFLLQRNSSSAGGRVSTDQCSYFAAAAAAATSVTPGGTGVGTGDHKQALLPSCTGSIASVRTQGILTLAEIDARLEALQGQQGRLSTFGSMMDVPPDNTLGSKQAGPLARKASLASVSSQASSMHSTGSKGGAVKARAVKGGTRSSCTGHPDTHDHSSGSGSEKARQQSKDYLQQQREQKELMKREHEIDAQLRTLKTSELPTRLTRQQLQALLAECAGSRATSAAGSTLQSCSSMQSQPC